MKLIGLLLFFGLILILLISSCSGSKKIDSLKPEPSIDAPLVYNTQTSFISMPLYLTASDIQKQINRSLTDIIYQDSILDDDNIEIQIWKTSDIKINIENKYIITDLPLKAIAKVKYGTDFLGLNDTRTINLKGHMKLKSSITLQNLVLNTKSELIDFSWDESPNIEIAGKKISVTYLINPAINLFKKKLVASIDKTIQEKNDYKPLVLEIIDTLSKPVLTSDVYEMWIKMNPLEILSTDIQVLQNEVKVDLGLKCTMVTTVGQIPQSKSNHTNIKFTYTNNMPKNFNVTVAGISTYKNASRIISNNFRNQEFTFKNKKVKVNDVNLWYKDDKVIIDLGIDGSVKGEIYLYGYPKYDTLKQEIYFDDLQYVLNTKNILIKSANWMLGGIFLSKIQNLCRYSIQSNINDARNSLKFYLSNYSPMKGVFVNGDVHSFTFDRMVINKDAMIAFLSIKGNVITKVDGYEP